MTRQITDYQAKYFAHEITKRCSSDSLEKLTGALFDAQVDLNPHQIEAALFAFKSPLSNGAILADEVGLGKTIEAGLVLSQKWAEGKKKILIISPTSLRKQWNQELLEKFFLPSTILEAKTFNSDLQKGKKNPFEQNDIVITSFHFASNKDDYLVQIPWDLVIIDEAHRLRNVYKKSNKIAKKIRSALKSTPKVLLTATPLQNSLMELYGLVSFIDEYAFGDVKSFRSQYARISSPAVYQQLRERLKPISHRTLRRQVLEYIKYTNRIPLTQEFYPSAEEQLLYDKVSDYLQSPTLQALPSAQRKLMTLVLRKLLASSTFAIAGALNTLTSKLERMLKQNERLTDYYSDFSDDEDIISELKDEYGLEDQDELPEPLTPDEISAIEDEISELASFRTLATSITENAKGLALIEALNIGFKKTVELGSAQKALIFTESRRTQDYLIDLLSNNEYEGKLVLFNGSNNDAQSKEIYESWRERNLGTDKFTGSRTADMRSALIDHFKNHAQIMIATEAAAEGVNMQFCSLVVNYDLPWNPQRIEQRIGRCHRYGQKHDVVVINFLNKNNAADQRVYELLSEKFSLFDGVFGASDEVLGSIESGVDFEQRIMGIYQDCRTPDEINYEFDLLQNEMEDQISSAMEETKQKLLEHFDAEVHDKLRVNLSKSEEYLNKHEEMLYMVTRNSLYRYASFNQDNYDFKLLKNPFSTEFPDIPTGLYKMGSPNNRPVEGAHIYRPNHSLAKSVLSQAKSKPLPSARLIFRYTDTPTNAALVEPLVGQTGYMNLTKLEVSSAEYEEHLVFSAFSESGDSVSQEQLARLLSSFPCTIDETEVEISQDTKNRLKEIFDNEKSKILDSIGSRNAQHFESEMVKLDAWADDLKEGLEQAIKDLDKEIREVRKQAKLAPTLEEKLVFQRGQKKLEKKRSAARRELFEKQDEVDNKREEMISEIEDRLEKNVSQTEIFTIEWIVV